MTNISVTITGLYSYPVKSCKPVALTSTVLTPQGIPYDRHWMIVNDENVFVTQRQNSKLALIESALTEQGLQLSLPGAEPITIAYAMPQGEIINTEVWGAPCVAIDEGAAVSQWLTQQLHSDKPLRLVRMAGDFIRLQNEPALQAAGNTNQHHVHFADAAPYLIANEASLEALNKALILAGEQPVPMNRFRPNIIIKGLPAFAEHNISSLGNQHCELNFKMACERCIITTIDQQTGQRDPAMQPFKLLKTLNGSADEKSSPMFGCYAGLEKGESVELMVADELVVVA
ncbi:MOSC N-terminal beta barrel domain-containing protein [Dasania sp. GY-MA-18]|uniref:MOSC N-terminal beta barrel domain-containing protein n=1 Tax=Dasania phycosphaerae TaxID=2950436 RepID=A0A9J6RJW2_9GAMM|nr:MULTISPECIES: MOSC N-terminal beta barrel domain-containing protein [Dasania]MCR8922051.1 MOSC N-terminal beta barrel domain-containing protein [Dasania sp. GY-MA-18]MCZ0864479.1 MOSC N-terminal beta barrel domain-containing protein [Dasania phycosphaerae]MCZ0868207.1 MOSC N-terminal beta barrel domain-containing protein [Dasania phycosphaerae]